MCVAVLHGKTIKRTFSVTKNSSRYNAVCLKTSDEIAAMRHPMKSDPRKMYKNVATAKITASGPALGETTSKKTRKDMHHDTARRKDDGGAGWLHCCHTVPQQPLTAAPSTQESHTCGG